MTIVKDVVGAVAPVAAIAVLGYLVAEKFGLIGDDSKDDATGDWDPLHVQDAARAAQEWLAGLKPEPGATFDKQTGFDSTYNIFPTDQPSTLVSAIDEFKARTPPSVDAYLCTDPTKWMMPHGVTWDISHLLSDGAVVPKAPTGAGGSTGDSVLAASAVSRGVPVKASPGVVGRKSTYSSDRMRSEVSSVAERIANRALMRF